MTRHLFAAIGFALALAPAAAADPFRISVDQTVALKLASPANSVAVGNAALADVSVHDSNTLLITGKAFGTTNLTVLDRAGRVIWSNQLAVVGEPASEMTIVRGANTYTFSCPTGTKCHATPMVGDEAKAFEDVMTSITKKAEAAKGSQ